MRESMSGKQQWSCGKCDSQEAETGTIRTTGDWASRYLNMQNQKFDYVSCAQCGYTDFFRAAGGGGWRNVLDVLTN